jgi:alpha-mannosidase
MSKTKPNKDRSGGLSRREFVTGVATLAGTELLGFLARAKTIGAVAAPREVFIVPHFHPASCGWLTTFSKERVYCANSYLSHLDRVEKDSEYGFVMSEVNNFIAVKNFRPERFEALQERVREGRVEPVNAFFLESTVNLSGGEALARMGAEGARWYEKFFGVRPRHAWCIDTCGLHDQMAQIAHGLGLETLVYTRRNPTDKTIFWTEAPDGSRVLTLCPGSYGQVSSVFESKTRLTAAEMDKLEEQFAEKDKMTPDGIPLMVLGSGGDYSVAPPVQDYPTALLTEWKEAGRERKVRFTTLSKYLDSILPSIKSGKTKLQTHVGGTAYDYDAFWIENPKVKTWYRRSEEGLQVAEALAAIASLNGGYEYPSQRLYEAWVLMFLNTDRNTLWGAAGGMVFVDAESWDVKDRFEWVAKTVNDVQRSAGGALLGRGDESAVFNPLNWRRNDPVVLMLPEGKSVEGAACEALTDGRVLCMSPMESVSVSYLKLVDRAPEKAKAIKSTDVIETSHYALKLDPATGAIANLEFRKTGREILGGPANVVIAERPRKQPDDAGDHMPPIPERERLATSNESRPKIEVQKGPLTTTVVVTGTFFGGGELRRSITMYDGHGRIDFETELNDVPNYTVVFTDFPLAKDIDEVRRGVPFGFSHSAWAKPKANLHGWAKGVVPAVRWSDYTFEGGGGVAFFDRGLSGRELNGRTASIYLLNAEDKYWGYENPWLTGKGKHVLQFALMPHQMTWQQARIPQAAWEYNLAPVTLSESATRDGQSYVETSNNVIVESLRREGDHIVLRLVEAFGKAGPAHVKLLLPHNGAAVTDLAGRHPMELRGGPEYRLSLLPQQIVTIHFRTESSVCDEVLVTEWDKFVPIQKLEALHKYDPKLVGHPPFGR